MFPGSLQIVAGRYLHHPKSQVIDIDPTGSKGAGGDGNPGEGGYCTWGAWNLAPWLGSAVYGAPGPRDQAPGHEDHGPHGRLRLGEQCAQPVGAQLRPDLQDGPEPDQCDARRRARREQEAGHAPPPSVKKPRASLTGYDTDVAVVRDGRLPLSDTGPLAS
jgi:hypothetical protein